MEFRIALPILYLSFLVDRTPQWRLQFLKLVKPHFDLLVGSHFDLFIRVLVVQLLLICLRSGIHMEFGL
jgi:hypothetical protein